ncbi:hypothetical protein [Corynebacterium gerontici]|uniref:Uncharacterized protein n=1 Tax=Corynebacterium gerontici TaxID=2079234 RepID=A0A3G6J341_9CORY|nr:hypothetical protein [Corynebacterium gerontici]AZA12359.1 hypothetical protein CGERO_10385 [Corynebacterium gerontici]
MSPHIVSSSFEVAGIGSNRDVQRARQKLFDVFASHNIGQVAFELRGGGQPALMVLKHPEGAALDVEKLNEALKPYRIT